MATEKLKKDAPSISPITDHKIPRELSSPFPFYGKTSISLISLGNHISKCREREMVETIYPI